jgi:hypothetical protein
MPAKIQPGGDFRRGVGKGTLSVALPPGGVLQASYRGDLAVTDFASIDKRSTQDLLRGRTCRSARSIFSSCR